MGTLLAADANYHVTQRLPLGAATKWDYAAIDGLGFGHSLHVGDSTWFAGIMFDL